MKPFALDGFDGRAGGAAPNGGIMAGGERAPFVNFGFIAVRTDNLNAGVAVMKFAPRRLVGRPGRCLLRFAAGRLSGGFRWSCGGVT